MDRCPGTDRPRDWGRMRVALAVALGMLVPPVPAAAQEWGSDAALALARRAVLRRSGAVADRVVYWDRR